MLAEIITIGDEILIGQIVDTNSAYIAPMLNAVGIKVKQISSVSDDKHHILAALAEAKERADIIIITGGLGPTKDDITKKTLCEYFNTSLVRNEAALDNVKQIFERFNRPLIDINIQQADVPANCTVMLNENGTAPGMYFMEENTHYFSMPGVPQEMKLMMDTSVMPILKGKLSGLPQIVHQTILTSGLGESFIAEAISEVEDSLPTHIKLAYLPKYGTVRLRLSGTGMDKAVLEAEIDIFVQKIIAILVQNVVNVGDISLEELILQKLVANNATLSVAESCTGGYISHLFTSIAGSSQAFWGGVVAYDNSLKTKILNVPTNTIETQGAVSQEVVEAMALGALNTFNTTYAIACSGVAGPTGGTAEKPVGTVWIAIAHKDKVIAKKFLFGNNRVTNIERTAAVALHLLLMEL